MFFSHKIYAVSKYIRGQQIFLQLKRYPKINIPLIPKKECNFSIHRLSSLNLSDIFMLI